MLPITEQQGLLQHILPENPQNGEVYAVPEGQIAGASILVCVYKGNTPVGVAAHLAAIPNVSNAAWLHRVVCSDPINTGDIVLVRGERMLFKSVIFIDGFGWLGYEVYDKIDVIHEKTYKVLHAFILPQQNAKQLIYERLCLNLQQEETKK